MWKNVVPQADQKKPTQKTKEQWLKWEFKLQFQVWRARGTVPKGPSPRAGVSTQRSLRSSTWKGWAGALRAPRKMLRLQTTCKGKSHTSQKTVLVERLCCSPGYSNARRRKGWGRCLVRLFMFWWLQQTVHVKHGQQQPTGLWKHGV